MERIVINGGKPLSGEVVISGAKNAAVAILPATILAHGVCRLENIPDISDVRMMIQILTQLGARVTRIDDTTYEIDTSGVNDYVVPNELTKHLRASYYLLGALLGRFRRAKVAAPGGCNFCVRPIDLHLKGFEALGAKVEMQQQAFIDVKADILEGGLIYSDVVSVGATMNIMLAAVRAKGTTIIENAAREPHIVDLANFLNCMGADVRNAGTDTIKIYGVEEMHGCSYSIIPDQIEAGTFMVAAAATRGAVTIKNVTPKHLEAITAKLRQCGVAVEEDEENGAVFVKGTGRPAACHIKTAPHPGFPTDMQPQFATMLAVAEGTSIVSESVWDSRFQYAEKLINMGANIIVNGKAITIVGMEKLNAAPVVADDLRAGAAMLIAGLIAEGETSIENVHFIDRGYYNVVGKLKNLGADIKRVSDNDGPHLVEKSNQAG